MLELLIDGVSVATALNSWPLTHSSTIAAIGSTVGGVYTFAGHIKNIVLEVTS